MNLGDKLKSNIAMEADLIRKAEEQRLAEERRKITNRKNVRWAALRNIQEEITKCVNSGGIPKVKCRYPTTIDWIRSVSLGRGPGIEDYELWAAFIEWSYSEGIRPKVVECYDGMGMSSWIEIHVVPRPGPEIEAD